ncbi:hypothetical protein OKW35_009766 [Paraburkholderia sp. MM5477-R1]
MLRREEHKSAARRVSRASSNSPLAWRPRSGPRLQYEPSGARWPAEMWYDEAPTVLVRAIPTGVGRPLLP